MYTSESILEAARSIRPYLSELLPEAEAKAVDQQLSDLLNTRQPIDKSILEVLTAKNTTREWLSKFLEDKKQNVTRGFSSLPGHLSPVVTRNAKINLSSASGDFSSLPGDPSLVSAAKFVCPQGDYIWSRPRVGIEPPHCPTHNQPLVLVMLFPA